MTKNKFILKSVSLFLSFWMLLASTGLSVDYHYCEGKLVDWSFINSDLECDHEEEQEVDSCCEAEVKGSCNDSQSQFEKSNCCSSDQAMLLVESKFDKTNYTADFTLPQFIILSQIVVPELCKEQQEFIGVLKESPPILYTSEQSFIQSFLI